MKDVEIRPIGSIARDALLGMYRGFDPLGAAQGLPPLREDAQRAWIERLLREALNWGAFAAEGRLIGHALLARSGFVEAEIAFFVHQDFRGRTVGTRIVRAALASAPELGYRRIWASVCADNLPALRLLLGQGFRRSWMAFPFLELELLVEARPALKVAS